MTPYYVYLISDGELIKIGYAANVISRLKDLQVGNGRELSILETFKVENKRNAGWVERLAHDVFREARVSGEWFRVDPSEAKSKCSAMIKIMFPTHTPKRKGRLIDQIAVQVMDIDMRKNP